MIIIIVALACTWSMAGHIVWSIAQQATYQYVQHVKKERSFRDTLILHSNTYSNTRTVVQVKKDEIRYADRMFDIKHRITKGDSIILVGHYDDLEHELYKSLQKILDNEENHPQQKSNSWNIFVALLPNTENAYTASYVVVQHHKNIWKNSFQYSIAIPPPHYPPDYFI